MNIDITKLRGPIPLARFMQDKGWCSSPFFQVSAALIEMLSARGVNFGFNRIGPVVSKDGVRLFLMTTGYTPDGSFNMPITDSSANYMHAIGLDGVPFFQVHCSEQQKLVQFAFDQFKDLFDQTPVTEDERKKLDNAITSYPSGN